MASFRKEILGQIERIDTGRIFTFRDLSFETEKTANVAVLLSEQSRKKGYWYGLKRGVLPSQEISAGAGEAACLSG